MGATNTNPATHNRVVAMATDPECTGDLLAIGTALSAILDGGLCDGTITTHAVKRLAFGDIPGDVVEWRRSRLGLVLRSDIRRYMPPSMPGTCGSPTPRKPRCGRRASWHTYVQDQATGEKHPLESCSQHHAWFNNEDSKQEPQVGAVPLPYANTGGVLARHFPEFNWHRLWRSLDSTWTPLPERPEPEPATPELTAVTGGGETPAARRRKHLWAVPTVDLTD